ncbi:MAG: hypothetical protein GY880_17595 [Planctomycetaceae bacterium]|nr:hypothetical protein [Planctomycetaceae bacterium]
MGQIQSVRSTRTDSNRRCNSRFRDSVGYLGIVLCLTGCAITKKAGIVAGVTAIGAGAATVLSGGATVPTLAAATTSAFVADAVIEVMDTTPTSAGVLECPAQVTGFWPLMGQVIETGGWLLAGVILLPLVFGYLIPNGFERKK